MNQSIWAVLLWLGVTSAWAQSDTLTSQSTSATPTVVAVNGVVNEQVNSKIQPLVGATVRWLETSVGTITDSVGRFSLAQEVGYNRLVVSYVGYHTDTVTVGNAASELNIMLRAEQTLQEVTVSAQPGQMDRVNPIQTEFISQRTLAKAACCNLSESFETNASMSVSYADAVTGARQIQFLGLGGQYVQTNVENIPTVRGLATTFGLSFIPGTWITGIDMGKGAGSVVNGYESISGQLNVELQKPDEYGAPLPNHLFLNGYVNSFGRVEGNVNWSQPLGKRWSTAVLGHASTLKREIDQNNDGFRDLPFYTQLNAINRYKYSSERFMAQFGVKVLNETREGGQLARFGANRYVFGNTTKRLEVFSKLAKLFPDKPYKGLGLILNAVNHEQITTFGYRPYTGQQRTVYANLIYQGIIDNTNHTVKTGVSYLLDDYREQLGTTPLNRTESVPGVFGEYTYTYPEKLTLVLGGRVDFHNLFGVQWTPRAHLKYDVNPTLSLRASAGRGFRVPNRLAENIGYLVSSRAVFFDSPLQPERAWNYGLSASQDFRLLGKKASLVVDYFRTDFQNQLIVDAEHPRELHFYNLQGRSFANSFQAELNVQPARRLEVKAAYRFFDVQQTMGGPFGESRLLPRMMVSRDRVLLNAGYALPFDKWKFDATLQWNGPRRIPYLREGYEHTSYANMPVEFAPGFREPERAGKPGVQERLGNLSGGRKPDRISPDQPHCSPQ